MKILTLTTAGISLAIALAAPVWADSGGAHNDKGVSSPNEMLDHGMDRSSKSVDGMSMTEGSLRKVDMENRKVTIKHGPIKNLEMPPMTMVFGVDENVDMSGLAAGDGIDFRVVNEGGKMIVTQIKPR